MIYLHKNFFFLIILCIVFSCGKNERKHAELVILNAKILTIDTDQPIAEAIAIQGETILAVGTSDQIKEFIDHKSTHVIDARGKLITPGFNDSHVHLDGIDPDYVDLRYITNQSEMARRLKNQVEKSEKGVLIMGGNWEHEMFENKQWPTKETIDSVSPNNPVILFRADGHSLLANTLAMNMAGISIETPDPSGGTIMRDNRGEATGIFQEKARELIRYNVKSVSGTNKNTEEYEMEKWRAGFKHASSLGVTSVHRLCASLDSVGIDPSVYLKFKESGDLSYRVYFSGKFPASDDQLQEYVKLAKKFPKENDWIRFGPLKGHIDGTLGSGTMMVFDPFIDKPHIGLGLEQMPYNQFEDRVLAADRLGLQLTIHAIGPRGNDWVLNAYQRAQEINGIRDSRHRIEHAQILREKDIERFKELGVIPSMQASHVITDKRFAEKRMGMKRLQYAYAWKSLYDAGVKIAFGSDYPVEPLNPMLGLYAAVSRKDILGEQGDGWLPKERITMEEAIELFTLGSAYAEFMEDRKGKLKKGYLADLVILDRNLLTIPNEEILKTKIDYTIVGGKIVYTRKEK